MFKKEKYHVHDYLTSWKWATIIFYLLVKVINPFTPRVNLWVNKCGCIPFESVDETLVCDHLNESYWVVLSCGNVTILQNEIHMNEIFVSFELSTLGSEWVKLHETLEHETYMK